jgi:hypothetical protein
MKYSIGITTYEYRFDQWLKPLVQKIKQLRPEAEIHIAVNGEHNKRFDEEYRKKVLQFISEQNNTFVFMYPTFRSLSKLWNNLIINSSNHNVLILNDDVTITDRSFFDSLESVSYDIFKINGSWSHAMFDRRVVDDIGWFDERYLGIGEEDGDFEWRYGNKTQGRSIPSVSLPGIINHVDSKNCLQGINVVNGKYSKFNLEFAFNKKYEESTTGRNYGIMNKLLKCVSPTPPLHTTESFYWENRDKL